MDDRYLATGFAGLDRLEDVSVFADCLRLLDTLPAMRAVKDESLALLAPGPGMRILEAGCGLGAEARRLAGVGGPTGGVVGLDASRAMLGRAARVDGPPVTWVQADAARLPFAEAVFDACRVERMLQHVDDRSGPGRPGGPTPSWRPGRASTRPERRPSPPTARPIGGNISKNWPSWGRCRLPLQLFENIKRVV